MTQQQEADYCADMAWAVPAHTRGAVDRAGAALVADRGTGPPNIEWVEAYFAALDVINNWRAAHAFPLNTFQSTLQKKARAIDAQALVAQRTKRLASIDAKLRNEPWLRLSRMQDIGGCRAIMPSMAGVRALVRSYERSELKHEWVGKDDYIEEPRESGYRGVHLKYRYFSDKQTTYNGLRIEVQIRTALQHEWATAVETVGTLVRQSLKASQGSDEWLRFFALMGTWMAVQEKTTRVVGTPSDNDELKKEIRHYAQILDVANRLNNYASVVRIIEDPTVRRRRTEFTYFLVVLDPSATQTVEVIPYGVYELAQATEEYSRREEMVRVTPGGEAVLVAVEDMVSLRRAYPNYFLDTNAFVAEVGKAIA